MVSAPHTKHQLHKVYRWYFLIPVLSLLFLPIYTVHAATISIPNASGGTTVLPTSGGSTLDGTDLYTPPPITQQQALDQDYSLGSTDLGGSASGGSGPAMNTIEGIINSSAKFLNRLAPFIITLTLLTFLWGMLQLVRGGSEEARKEGRQIITFGVVALFVMVSVWGLVNILRKSFQLTGANIAPQGPGVPRFK